MDDSRTLRDDFAVFQRHDHVMARLRQIGGEPLAVDRFVEDPLDDPLEQRFVPRFHLPEFHLHFRHVPHRPPALAAGGTFVQRVDSTQPLG